MILVLWYTLHLLVAVVSIHLVFRYFLLTKYSRLRKLKNENHSGILDLLPAAKPEMAIGGDIPSDARNLGSLKIFEFLEEPVLSLLRNSLEKLELEEGAMLYERGTTKRDIYIVEVGRISVFLHQTKSLEAKGSHLLHQVQAGELLTSFFGILDLLTRNTSLIAPWQNTSKQDIGRPSRSGSVRLSVPDSRPIQQSSTSAKAATKSSLLVIKEDKFMEIMESNHTATTSIIQVILSRFQRVTFMTLFRYLGMTGELLKIERCLNDLRDYRQLQRISFPLNQTLDDVSKLKQIVFDSISRVLGFDHLIGSKKNPISGFPEKFIDSIQIASFAAGEEVVGYEEKIGNIYFVLSGTMQIFVLDESELFGSKHPARETKLFDISPGGLTGYLAAFIPHPSLTCLRSATDTLVGVIKNETILKISEICPEILFKLAKRLVFELSPLIDHLDVALGWFNLSAGQILFSQGAEAENIYIPLHGRLRATKERKFPDLSEIKCEFGPNESIGEFEVLSGNRRPYTVHAIRDSEIVAVPKTLFQILAVKHPDITLRLSKSIAKKFADENANSLGNGLKLTENFNRNLRTVAILPASTQVPIAHFAHQLKEELELHSSILLLDNSRVLETLGKHAFSSIGRLKLLSWLAEEEETFGIVLYVADDFHSPWTQRCIKQADCILVVAIAEGDSGRNATDELLQLVKTWGRKELVLLHKTNYCRAGLTHRWLRNRPFITDHHHVLMEGLPGTVLNDSQASVFKHVRKKLQLYYQAARGWDFPLGRKSSNDFARLARKLMGKSIGLVLGGGGARGISHVGVIQALEEAGVPIDIVGGTSIGSFVGGLYARDTGHVPIYGIMKAFSGRLASKWRMLLDVTYPITSWFTGHEFNRAIWKCFREQRIEDLWLPYFCITTNITNSRMEVHREGYLWRYVRASMSLSGFLPPLCDNGKMLLDGGYCNILPADVMKMLGAKHILAIDVASEKDSRYIEYGDSVSGWYLLLMRLLGKQIEVPSLADIQSKLAFASSVQKLEMTKSMPNVVYLRPPVASFNTLDFQKFDEIFLIGYNYGKMAVEKLKERGIFEEITARATIKKSKVHRRNSI